MTARKPLRILQLCKKFPYPLKDGESLAVTYLSKALHELGCEITLLAMNTSKHFFDISQLPADFSHYKNINTVALDNEIRSLDAFNNLFSKKSFHINRFESATYKKKLEELLRENTFDIVQLETLYLATFVDTIRSHSQALVVMRSHNVEFEIWERISHNTSNFFKKLYLNYLTKKLKNYEISKLNDYDFLLPITVRDENKFKDFGCKIPQLVVPIGLDISNYMAESASFNNINLSISFIGSLDWLPNLEGLNWFLTNVWTKINSQFPDIQFVIAGRNTPNWLRQKQYPQVKVAGEVASAVDFINQHPIMVVPLWSGGGMRAKILEGMALGRVIITTSIGLEGIEAQNMSEILIANTSDEMLEQLRFCDENREKMIEIGQRAQVFVATRYDNYEIAENLISKYREIIICKSEISTF